MSFTNVNLKRWPLSLIGAINLGFAHRNLLLSDTLHHGSTKNSLASGDPFLLLHFWNTCTHTAQSCCHFNPPHTCTFCCRAWADTAEPPTAAERAEPASQAQLQPRCPCPGAHTRGAAPKRSTNSTAHFSPLETATKHLFTTTAAPSQGVSQHGYFGPYQWQT